MLPGVVALPESRSTPGYYRPPFQGFHYAAAPTNQEFRRRLEITTDRIGRTISRDTNTECQILCFGLNSKLEFNVRKNQFDLSRKFGVADMMKMLALFGRFQGSMDFRFAILLPAALLAISLAGCASPHDIVDEAVKDNDVQKVTSMVESDPSLVSSQDKGGDTLLHWTAAKDHQSLAELLINDKADVNAQNVEGDTPLHLAAGNGHSDIMELLLMHNAEVDARNNGGATPLDKAAQYDHPRQVELLLSRGANVQTKDKNGDSPLHYAAMSGSQDSVQILLDHGAVVNAENEDGLTPLRQAVLNGHNKVALLLSQHGGHE